MAQDEPQQTPEAPVKVESAVDEYPFLVGIGLRKGKRGKQRRRDVADLAKLLAPLQESDDTPAEDEEALVAEALFDLANMGSKDWHAPVQAYTPEHAEGGEPDLGDEEGDAAAHIVSRTRGRRRTAARAHHDDWNEEDDDTDPPSNHKRGSRGGRGGELKRARVWHNNSHDAPAGKAPRGGHEARRGGGRGRQAAHSSSPEYEAADDVAAAKPAAAGNGNGLPVVRPGGHAQKGLPQPGMLPGWGLVHPAMAPHLHPPPPNSVKRTADAGVGQRPPSRGPSNTYPGPGGMTFPPPIPSLPAPMSQMLQRMGNVYAVPLQNGMTLPVTVGPDGQLPVPGWPGMPFLSPALGHMAAHGLLANQMAGAGGARLVAGGPRLAMAGPGIPLVSTQPPAEAQGAQGAHAQQSQSPARQRQQPQQQQQQQQQPAASPGPPEAAAMSQPAARPGNSTQADGDAAAGTSQAANGPTRPLSRGNRKTSLLHVEIAHFIQARQKQAKEVASAEGAGEAPATGKLRGEGASDACVRGECESGAGAGVCGDQPQPASSHSGSGDGPAASRPAKQDAAAADQPALKHKRESDGDQSTSALNESLPHSRSHSHPVPVAIDAAGLPQYALGGLQGPGQAVSHEAHASGQDRSTKARGRAGQVAAAEREGATGSDGQPPVPATHAEAPGPSHRFNPALDAAPVQGLPYGLNPLNPNAALVYAMLQAQALAAGRPPGAQGLPRDGLPMPLPHMLGPPLVRAMQGAPGGGGAPAGFPPQLAMLAGGPGGIPLVSGLQLAPGMAVPLSAAQGLGPAQGLPPPGLGYVLAMTGGPHGYKQPGLPPGPSGASSAGPGPRAGAPPH